jgi:threonine synthase
VVSDEEILAAMRELGREAAIFAEPAGAAGYAGFKRALEQGLIESHEWVVVLVTGNGLKDVDSAIMATTKPPRIEPRMEELRRSIGQVSS